MALGAHIWEEDLVKNGAEAAEALIEAASVEDEEVIEAASEVGEAETGATLGQEKWIPEENTDRIAVKDRIEPV